jgi:putative component of membrane protein insertase Oxa1/YidC/SpoIIIJ protein YidD
MADQDVQEFESDLKRYEAANKRSMRWDLSWASPDSACRFVPEASSFSFKHISRTGSLTPGAQRFDSLYVHGAMF